MTVGKMYLPKTADNYDEAYEEICRNLAEEWGGYTAYDGQGGWVDGDGNLVEEPVTVIETVLSSTDDGGALYSHLSGLAVDIRMLTGEDSILAYVGAGENASGERILA